MYSGRCYWGETEVTATGCIYRAWLFLSEPPQQVWADVILRLIFGGGLLSQIGFWIPISVGIAMLVTIVL